MIDHVEKTFDLLPVLKDVSFSIGRSQKAALIGNNGSGKSTLLKIIAGQETADRGRIHVDPGVRIGYVPQDIVFSEDATIEDALRAATGDHDGSFERRMNLLLRGFDFDVRDHAKKISVLSGGQRRKLYLVRTLLEGADLLLLDEPTNDLDLPAIIWLEHLLAASDAAVIVASHDRSFLDHVVQKIVEVDDVTHAVRITGGTYSDYLIASEKKRERLRAEYCEQREEIARLGKRATELKIASARGSAWEGRDNDKLLRDFKRDRAGRSGKRAKAIEKRIEQIEKIEKPFERKPLELLLPKEGKHGNRDIILEEIVAGYPDGFHMQPCSLSIPFGRRLCFIGRNGSGKSTFLQTVIGKLPPLEGEVRIGSGVCFGHLAQEHDALDRDATPLQILQSRAGLVLEKSFLLLDIFSIDPKRAHDPIRLFSPGGRVRLLFALFSALGVNVLVLDEPTNHLDLEALSALEEALETFEGTVILVSHDRTFIERVRLDATSLFAKDGTMTSVPDYRAYIDAIERDAKVLFSEIRSVRF
jgi:ATPase subunit of ABC transporter with duplicated ATPase domains